jgi:hypothetical protein
MHLKYIGGKNLKAILSRILGKLFSETIINLCNWTGKYQKTALKDLHLIKIVIGNSTYLNYSNF